MIELRVASRSRKKLKEVAKILHDERLAIDMNLMPPMERVRFVNGKFRKGLIHMLTAKTKALLFPTIDERLKQKYRGHMPELYSIPIVHMDWDQTRELASSVINV